MSQINLIQTFCKGFSFFFPETKKNLVLKDFSKLLTQEEDLSKHFFIYFDNRLGRGFRVFLQTESPLDVLQNRFSAFLKNYSSNQQNANIPHQFFKTYPTFSVVPIRFIEENDEIITTKKQIHSIQLFLENLSSLIVQKTEEFDFSDDNQKLEFTLELLIAGVAFNQFPMPCIQQEFKRLLKLNPTYKKYLVDKYSSAIRDSKEAIFVFKKTLILAENEYNFLSEFWKKNQVDDAQKIFELIFKVLNINMQQKCYCLFVLQNTAE